VLVLADAQIVSDASSSIDSAEGTVEFAISSGVGRTFSGIIGRGSSGVSAGSVLKSGEGTIATKHYRVATLNVDTGTLRVIGTSGGTGTLDGYVNINDSARVGSNFNMSGKLWQDGDFNYDGTVYLGDYGLMASNWQVLPMPDNLLARGIPEPAIGVVLTALIAVMRRRRST
jgi:hypothetical protein